MTQKPSDMEWKHLTQAVNLLSEATYPWEEPAAKGHATASATVVTHADRILAQKAYGRKGWASDEGPLSLDTPFLIASLTKPIVCAGAMLLVQSGYLTLEDPVADIVSRFGGQGKEQITIRHLMTHTSGLPDQLGDKNIELRKQHAGLEAFIEAVCRLAPSFQPGTKVSYQSMGLLMLGTVIERLTGQPLREFLAQELFEPLGMAHTTLGLPEAGLSHTVRAQSSGDANYGGEDADWGWNSRYWRDLGAPWGGLHATAPDLSLFLRHMLGLLPGPLSPAARRTMVSDQIAPMPDIPARQKLTDRWGLGWRLGMPLLDLVSPQTFSHTGATGTLFWADPETGLSCVLLTNQPNSRKLFGRYSNAVAAAVRG